LADGVHVSSVSAEQDVESNRVEIASEQVTVELPQLQSHSAGSVCRLM